MQMALPQGHRIPMYHAHSLGTLYADTHAPFYTCPPAGAPARGPPLSNGEVCGGERLQVVIGIAVSASRVLRARFTREARGDSAGSAGSLVGANVLQNRIAVGWASTYPCSCATHVRRAHAVRWFPCPCLPPRQTHAALEADASLGQWHLLSTYGPYKWTLLNRA